MELITSVTVGSGGTASVTLPATGTIPATYTDLKVLISSRASGSGGAAWSDIVIKPNNSTTGIATRVFYGTGSAPGSTTFTTGIPAVGEGNVGTANTFGNTEIYIPNYTSSNFKSFSADSVSENNATASLAQLGAMLWSNTSAITSLVFTDFGSANFVEGSTFYLYGISSVTSTPKATGGMVSQDDTYWYHTFASSGVFAPTEALSADILSVAGGGSGGTRFGGGGGAGGVLLLSSQSLTAINYAVVVGAGGAGRAATGTGSGAQGLNGGNSQFASLTAAVGGGGGGAGDSSNGNSGGSGGGSTGRSSRSGGSPTSGQGFAGGGSNGSRPYSGAGGGGAGSVGFNAQPIGTNKGRGGAGTSSYTSWLNATYTGVNGIIAGGGGGGASEDGASISVADSDPGFGGTGGGGRGGDYYITNNAVAGAVNTGSGGGGGAYNGSADNPSASGGSGLVIVRYAK
jgi:hypothetical protein